MKGRALVLFALLAGALCAKPVCVGDVCYPSEEAARKAGVLVLPGEETGENAKPAYRLTMGYQSAPEFLAFLRNEPSPARKLATHAVPLIVLLILLGGLAANLTPCVLPLVPVNLGLLLRDAPPRTGWQRGLAYGLGLTVVYGALGVAAALGGLAFGVVQASPWFNLAVAVLFVGLALASLDVFYLPALNRLDPRRFFRRQRTVGAGAARPPHRGLVGAFLLGTGAAVLAGACVEPILLATLLLTAEWYAAGRYWAILFPFVLGAGMGLPWPFAAAGLSVLPRPGAWMAWIKRLFAIVLFVLAAWYGRVAVKGFAGTGSADSDAARTESGRVSSAGARPVLYCIGAPWCRNCAAMERTTLRDPEVVSALAAFKVRRVEINDFRELSRYPDLENVPIQGLPAYVVVAAREASEAGNVMRKE